MLRFSPNLYTIRVHNSLIGKLQKFNPLVPNKVSMYVCGPTVYDRVHLGNCRSAIIFDVWFRFLSLFFDVCYVRNITDIDDKIIAYALQKGISAKMLADKNAKIYKKDLTDLNVLLPSHSPRATECIKEMQNMIQELIDKGLAYFSQGHVFFSVDKLSSYGTLTNRKLDDMISGARVEVNDAKLHPGDFVLWKPAKKNEPSWESTWGDGRPGWHIECSAMAALYLGEMFDIHGGGCDLMFPHHENERAQSCGLFGEDSFAKVWLHNGMLTVAGKKMSKSLGNFITIDTALSQYRPEVIRYVLLMAHYRQDSDFSSFATIQAERGLNKFYKIWQELDKSCGNDIDFSCANPSLVEGFIEALCDDLNTPKALSCLYGAMKNFNVSQDFDLGLAILFCGEILGFVDLDSQEYFSPTGWANLQKNNNTNDNQIKIDYSCIEEMIIKRNLARINKDFINADKIRDELKIMGIIIKDDKDGTHWQYDENEHYTKSSDY